MTTRVSEKHCSLRFKTVFDAKLISVRFRLPSLLQTQSRCKCSSPCLQPRLGAILSVVWVLDQGLFTFFGGALSALVVFLQRPTSLTSAHSTIRSYGSFAAELQRQICRGRLGGKGGEEKPQISDATVCSVLALVGPSFGPRGPSFAVLLAFWPETSLALRVALKGR